MATYYPCVAQALARPDKTVFAYFSDGRITQMDMKPEIARGGVFERLADEGFFADALTVLDDTVVWDLSGSYDPMNCIDIDSFTINDAQVVSDPLEEAVA